MYDILQEKVQTVKYDFERQLQSVENKISHTRQSTFRGMIWECTEFREDNSHPTKIKALIEFGYPTTNNSNQLLLHCSEMSDSEKAFWIYVATL